MGSARSAACGGCWSRKGKRRGHVTFARSGSERERALSAWRGEAWRREESAEGAGQLYHPERRLTTVGLRLRRKPGLPHTKLKRWLKKKV